MSISLAILLVSAEEHSEESDEDEMDEEEEDENVADGEYSEAEEAPVDEVDIAIDELSSVQQDELTARLFALHANQACEAKEFMENVRQPQRRRLQKCLTISSLDIVTGNTPRLWGRGRRSLRFQGLKGMTLTRYCLRCCVPQGP